MPRKICFLIFEGFQVLDVTGPMAAFELANVYRSDTYQLQAIALRPGAVASSSGVALVAAKVPRPEQVDTLLVSGGQGTRQALNCKKTSRYLVQCAASSRRVVSVCSGAYLLAAAGLLDGKTATTHWSRSRDFAARFPLVKLDADKIYTRAGKFWTSAGISAGIDLALALVAQDLGEGVAKKVAAQLVVYRRRPGGQSQFSALLELEKAGGRFSDLFDLIRSDLTMACDVESLAKRVAMSPRHFARQFAVETGFSPAKAVERLRLEAAQAAIESGERSLTDIAKSCGFGEVERMRRAFVRRLKMNPSVLRAVTQRQ